MRKSRKSAHYVAPIGNIIGGQRILMFDWAEINGNLLLRCKACGKIRDMGKVTSLDQLRGIYCECQRSQKGDI